MQKNSSELTKAARVVHTRARSDWVGLCLNGKNAFFASNESDAAKFYHEMDPIVR